MPKIIGVRFRGNGKIYYFSPGELEIKKGEGVIVETAQGKEYADVIIAPKEVREEDIVQPLKQVDRVATDDDYARIKENKEKETEAFKMCEKKIVKYELDMNLVNVDYSFDGKKVVFFFTSDGRVDFRELVKELAATFRTRIELRQIGVRDETKMKGGIGPCGREICCTSFMAGFHPVSIKMAKEQNISLNPTKISGLCGRLMCCLAHEYEVYCDIRPKLKRIGSNVMTADGPGVVVDNLILLEKCNVRVSFPGENVEMRQYPLDEVHYLNKEESETELEKLKHLKPQENTFKNPNETWDNEPTEEKKTGNANRKKPINKAHHRRQNSANYSNNNRNKNNDKKPEGDK